MSIVEKALERAKAAGADAARFNRGAAPVDARNDTVHSAERTTPESGRGGRDRASGSSLGLGNRVLVDIDSLRAAGAVAPITEERQIANQYRAIKRPLIKRAFQAPVSGAGERLLPRGILICSALPADGKTFTAINLALSIARERDCSVLLVDGDGAKRDLSRLFGLEGAPGLVDALVGPERSLESLISPTDVPGLAILPAGSRSETTTELYASDRMREILDSISALDSRCIIVLDSPPVLLTNEAQVLASLFGQVVMVVRAGATPQSAVLEALRLLGSGARVGLVLNHIETGGLGSYHYGNYDRAEYGEALPEPDASSDGT